MTRLPSSVDEYPCGQNHLLKDISGRQKKKTTSKKSEKICAKHMEHGEHYDSRHNDDGPSRLQGPYIVNANRKQRAKMATTKALNASFKPFFFAVSITSRYRQP